VKEGNVVIILRMIKLDEAVDLLQRAGMKVLEGKEMHT